MSVSLSRCEAFFQLLRFVSSSRPNAPRSRSLHVPVSEVSKLPNEINPHQVPTFEQANQTIDDFTKDGDGFRSCSFEGTTGICMSN